MKYIFVASFFFFCDLSPAQSNKIDSLLNAITVLQSKGDAFYPAGIFPSQRGKHRLKEDNNVFFTSLVAFTLKNNETNLSESNREKAEVICNNAISNYKLYQNKTGASTYNFWKTNPPQFFPNSRFLSRHSYFNIPDDIDVGSLIYLTDVSLNPHEFKHIMATHANLSKKKIKNTFKQYRNYKAYSTWIGKKMPIEFDICVLTNALYFVYENKLPLNQNDSASLLLIHDMIKSGKYLKQSYYVSPSYKNPSIVLYHLARLLGKYDIPMLEDCREQIRNDIHLALIRRPAFMEEIILTSSLIKMGGTQVLSIDYPVSFDKEFQKFSFFNANMFSVYARPSLRFMCRGKAFSIPFYNKAFCLSLLLEYENLSIQ